MSYTYPVRECVGTRRLRVRPPADPNAFAIGRVTVMPNGRHAVIISPMTGRGQWAAQYTDTGELAVITIGRGTRSDFPIVGTYADAATLY